jgi:hypothetical protein
VPNSQELQRGLRTREHRFLTAFLCRFHPTPGIESIYRAFAKKERNAAGDLLLGLFDLLYAPEEFGDVAPIPDQPLFAKDVGDLIAIARGEHRIAVSVSGGPKAGRRANFTLMPHNREFAPSLGAIDVSVDGVPVLCNISMGVYGQNSALTNTMCFEDGGALTNGQYLNGEIPPESCAVIRRCFIDDRFLYAHIVITNALDPKLGIKQADRILVFDRKSGTILLSDAFRSERPIRFATHLHCSGSVKEMGQSQYRLTGGQANLIAGIKSGSKGLSDDEKGELFVQILQDMPSSRVVVEEPAWVPAYIYGLNNTGQEDISEGRFPRYRRWRLEATDRVMEGSFLIAINPRRDPIRCAKGAMILPEAGGVHFGKGGTTACGVRCESECLLWDEDTRRIAAIGLRSLRHGDDEILFAVPVEVVYHADTGKGTIYAQGEPETVSKHGFAIGTGQAIADEGWKTQNPMRASLTRLQNQAGEEKSRA